MTREEKKQKRIARADRRGIKNRERNKVSDDVFLSMYARRRIAKRCIGVVWSDSNSETGYSQKCSYDGYGTCQYPCNGDC